MMKFIYSSSNFPDCQVLYGHLYDSCTMKHTLIYLLRKMIINHWNRSASDIGREIRRICMFKELFLERLKNIFQLHKGLKEESLFIENMVAETNSSVERNFQFLQKFIWL